MQFNSQISQKLSVMLREVNDNEGFRKFMKKVAQKMNFDKKNILNLTSEKVEMLYLNLKNKLIHASFIDQVVRNFQTSVWLQNQLRIFIYVLCAYLFLNKVTIQELKSQDYSLLQEFFPNKKQEHLEYQVKLLLNKKNLKWTIEQSRLFRQIMTENQQSNRWNFIAKQLYIRSTKKFFKTPKQCRQRWINHQDPKKLKGNWQPSEDINLLTSISLFGKKWTLIAHKLNDTRTQNNVKNRYNSIIKMAKKEYGHEKNEKVLIEILLRKKNWEFQGIQQINGEKNSQQLQQQKQKNYTTILGQQQQKCEKCLQHQFIGKMDLQPENNVLKGHDIHLKSSTLFNQNHNKDDLKFIFDELQSPENVDWNGSQSHQLFNEAFYFMGGSFCFDGVHHL